MSINTASMPKLIHGPQGALRFRAIVPGVACMLLGVLFVFRILLIFFLVVTADKDTSKIPIYLGIGIAEALIAFIFFALISVSK